MDTNWKGIDVFKGVVSLLAQLTLILVLTGSVAAVVYMMVPVFDDWLVLNALAQWASDLWEVMAMVAGGSILLLLAGLLVLAVLFRRERRQVARALGKGLGKLWVEVKLLLTVFYVGCALPLSRALSETVRPTAERKTYENGYMWTYFAYTPLEQSTVRLIIVIALSVLGVLWLYLLCLDISVNRRYFGHNILHSVLVWADRAKQEPPLAKLNARRFVVAAASTFAIILAALAALNIVEHAARFWQYPFLSPLVVLLGIGGGCGVWIWYTAGVRQVLRDTDALRVQIDELYGGDLNAPCTLSPVSLLYSSAMKLNMVRAGVDRAVREGVRAERMKVELITNVSHDIKTPLTSLISYTELLRQEKDLPEEAREYAEILAVKAERLKQIVQDVFDVSKAATGNITLHREVLDLGRLLRQTYAETEESLKAEELTWRLDIPEAPATVYADGQRLYRVFLNLFKNCAQYSLPGSRVYVTLTTDDREAAVTVQNVSRMELTRDGEELTGRFVRGDENRTTEGSGLGLSIARSFTEACGGVFTVRTEGDLFTVRVALPLYREPPQEAPAPDAPAPEMA